MNEILNNFKLDEDSLGREISLKAMLVIKRNDCYLVPMGEDDSSINKIEVYFPGLELQLDEAIGGWVGSSVIYFDEVHITGLLTKWTIRERPICISNIKYFSIFRDGEKYTIL
ncbi:Uncharacterised protein [Leminorella richardii]|uniref:Uncharacterized protein n=1 Tax=Leminorella richardii TaxID=158841 RepID=A0A2X4UWF4_9GAMM|nr:hypothetical protein [Leminorella richardii]SQI44177.1 Uncharacterised protein [Leminorella richardii]